MSVTSDPDGPMTGEHGHVGGMYGMAKLSAILDQIDGGTMLLPEFKCGYFRNPGLVCGLCAI